MSHQVVELNCPGCGARVSTAQKECDWCHKPIVISTFNSVYSMPMPEVNKYAGTYRKALTENPDNTELNKSIAMCYLKLKMYDKALGAFVHFAPVSGHWCVCQWPLGATSGRKLIDYFVFDHNVIMFCYPLKQRVG